VTLNDLERRNGVILHYFSEFGYLPGALRKSTRSLSHLLMSSCVCLFVYEISREPLNRFAPNSQGRRDWSLARANLNVKVKGQGHQDKRAVQSDHPRHRQNGTRSLQITSSSSERHHSVAAGGDFSGLRAVLGKTSLAVVCRLFTYLLLSM